MISSRRGIALALLMAGVLLTPTGAAAIGASPSPGTDGAVTGRVYFGAGSPPVKKIQVTLDQGVCGAEKTSPQFLISDSKGLGNVVVSITNAPHDAAAKPVASIDIEQNKCEYAPHLRAAYVGKDGVELVFHNKDGILHNVHGWHGEDTVFNFGQPGVLQELRTMIEFQKGVVEVRCDVHDWMSAYMVLLDNPYFSVTDADGSFSIAGLPAGEYTLTAWHEALGTMQKTVTVSADGSGSVDFEILPRQ